MPPFTDFKRCRHLINFWRKILDIRLKAVCAVEMKMYGHWTCININRIVDVHYKWPKVMLTTSAREKTINVLRQIFSQNVILE